MVTDSFAEMFDDAAYDGDAAATSAACRYASPALTWTGDLAAGARRRSITYSVTVDNPDTGDKLVINTVTSADAGSTCPPGTTSSPCQLTVPVLTPALTIVKTASTATAVPGQTVTYTITVTDSGQTPYTGATFTDDLTGALDDAAYNGDAAATAGSVSYAAPVLTWTGDLAPGASRPSPTPSPSTTPTPATTCSPTPSPRPTPGSNCAGRQHRPPLHRHRPGRPAHDRQRGRAWPPSPRAGSSATRSRRPTAGRSRSREPRSRPPRRPVLDDAAYNGDAAATAGTVALAADGQSLTWTGDLAAAPP